MKLVEPHGGTLRQLIVAEERLRELREEAVWLSSWDLTPPQVLDLELLLNGAFSPLEGFLTREEYTSVCADMRLPNGTIWPMPVTLDITEEFASSLSRGDRVALRHPEGIVLAVLTIRDKWQANIQDEANLVFGTTDDTHPGVFDLFHRKNPIYVGGPLEGLELPPHHTFKHLRYTPAELRSQFEKLGWKRIVAFQTYSPMHRGDVELTKVAAAKSKANLLIHPVIGPTEPGDGDCFARVRCYQVVLKHYSEQTTWLSLLPLAPRLAGPREAVWHAIIEKNYGCSHFIVDYDHASPRDIKREKPFYCPTDSSKLARQYEEELGIRIIDMEEMVYVDELGQYVPRSKVPDAARIFSLSDLELRRRLSDGLDVPKWFSYEEVIAELRQSCPPRSRQGFTVFFTGLSGAGKSTIANVLTAKLTEIGTRPVTLLDGDIVRKNLSSELGFSKEHRDLNIRRIGFVASEITKNRGVAICAPIAPYENIRREVRELINQHGGFVLVFVNTPLEVCEARDRKGMYAKARAGLIKQFTGISDPYEVPEDPEVVVDTSKMTADEAAQEIILYLQKMGYISSDHC